MMRKTLFTTIVLLFGLSTFAQTLTVTKEFTLVPNSSVLAMYKNQFGKWEKPDLDDTFPYAVIRMRLEGNAREVTMAKQRLTLYLGTQTAVVDRYAQNSNELLFLIPARRPTIYIDCGDGCDKVLLMENQQLQSNRVYDGVVHFVPEEEYVAPTTTQAPKRQFFKFRVSPANAVVTIVENGAQEILPMREGGIASKMLNYGTYNYSIAADKYHTKEGTFTVSATQTEMKVDLLPQFGWLTIAGDNTSQGGYVFATNTATGGRIQLGTIPLKNKEMSSGVYSLRIQKEKYKDYVTTITIEDGQTMTLQPVLEANFAQVTLTANEGADIYVDGNRLGTTRWTGTLELGEHSIETRQASHHSAYTKVRVTPQITGQTITLNHPLPIYGSLIVDGSPADVVVYVDEKKVGTSPLLVGELLIGTHTIRLEKEGYEKQAKTIAISEGQEHMLEYTLTENTQLSGLLDGHEYVDLGLSVKWATCNVGANSPEEYGDYFACGETEPKEVYDWSTYKYCNGSSSTLTKYNTVRSRGTVDKKTQLELSDDAARANWGGSWRMPTKAEQDELSNNCTWTWTIQNGVNGYKVTSKKNGNSIFLPAAGYRSVSSLDDAGNYGDYWSSSLYTGSPYYAYELYFNSDYVDRNNYDRYCGLSVRPVLGESKVTTAAITQITETSAVAGGNVTSDGNASVTERGVVYSTNPNPLITNLYNTIKPCGSGTGSFTCDLTNLQPNTTYYVRAYATNSMGTAYGEEVSFTTEEEETVVSDPTGAENGYGYVDLGLSVKWATCNVGASSPEEYGDYFAWGETEPKSIYDWSTYKYCNGSETTLTKYCTSSSNGTVDNKTTLELSDDAARANWGGSWRMPTAAELTELIDNCTRTWTTQNGVKGYKVTSKKNGNSIFLPAAGNRSGSLLDEAGSGGYYWLSSFSTGRPDCAWDLEFYLDSVYVVINYRCYGQSVRPVCP